MSLIQMLVGHRTESVSDMLDGAFLIAPYLLLVVKKATADLASAENRKIIFKTTNYGEINS